MFVVGIAIAAVIALALYLVAQLVRSGSPWADGPVIAAIAVTLAAVGLALVWNRPVVGTSREGFEAPDALPLSSNTSVPPMPKGMRLRSYFTTLSSESYNPREPWHLTDVAARAARDDDDEDASAPARLTWSSALHPSSSLVPAAGAEPPVLNAATMSLNIRDFKGALPLARVMPESTKEYTIFLMLKIDPSQWSATGSLSRVPILGISSHGNTRHVGISLFLSIDNASRQVTLGLEHGCENTGVSTSTAGACDAGNNYIGQISNQYLYETPASAADGVRAPPRFADAEFHLVSIVRSADSNTAVNTVDLYVDDVRAFSLNLPVRADVRCKPVDDFVEDSKYGLGMFLNEEGSAPVSIVTVGTYDVALSAQDLQDAVRHIRGYMLVHTNAMVRGIVEEAVKTRQMQMSQRQCTFEESVCNACSGVTDWGTAEGVANAGSGCQRMVVGACEAALASADDADLPPLCRELTKDRAMKILQVVSPGDYLVLTNLMASGAAARDASVDLIELDKSSRGSAPASGAPVRSEILESVIREGEQPPDRIVRLGSAPPKEGLRYVAPVTQPVASDAEDRALVDVGMDSSSGEAAGGLVDDRTAYDNIIDRFHRESLSAEAPSAAKGDARGGGGFMQTVGGWVDDGLGSIGKLFAW